MKDDSEITNDNSSKDAMINVADSVSSETKSKERKFVSVQFAEWTLQFEKEETHEKKIRMTIDFMRSLLSQNQTPHFKDFWECCRLCLHLFKEGFPIKLRTQLWGEYIELSSEARRLKDLLDEQSVFAVEQIELAIQSIESRLEHFSVLLGHAPDIAFPQANVSLKEKREMYILTQKELQLLNTLAIHINALRKEIIKTEMRIRIKNKLLERLSACGDRVFPKRKELIKNISEEFSKDIDYFIQTYFKTSELKELPLHVLREEIKLLQLTAKILTLNTHVFADTRLKLSACWDQVKSQEKERKKEVYEKKLIFRKSFDVVLKKINDLAADCAGEMSNNECAFRSHEILEFMKTVELGKDEVRALKDELYKVKKIVLDRDQVKQQERISKEKEIELKRREKIDAFKGELVSLIQSLEQFDLDQMNAKREKLIKGVDSLYLNKIEKQTVDRLFKQLNDAITEQKEKQILSLSEDDLKSLEQLKMLLQKRLERRREVKSQLEQYRKALGGSGFDFEKAMMYRDHIKSEKSSLEKIDTAIEELEQKIQDIEG